MCTFSLKSVSMQNPTWKAANAMRLPISDFHLRQAVAMSFSFKNSGMVWIRLF